MPSNELKSGVSVGVAFKFWIQLEDVFKTLPGELIVAGQQILNTLVELLLCDLCCVSQRSDLFLFETLVVTGHN
jgi:hypothetical protein